MIFQKILLTSAAIFITCAFYACSDDSSTGLNTLKISSKLQLDEMNQYGTSTTNSSNEYCILGSGNVSWKSISQQVVEKFKYNFINDTLIIYVYDDDEEEYDSRGGVYVGGKTGKIYGKWTYIPQCYAYDGEITCNDDSDYDNFKAIITISKNSIVAKVTLLDDDDDEQRTFDNFTESEFMKDMYYSFYSGSTAFYPDGLFRSADIDEDDYSIIIHSQDKNNVSFTINDQVVSINVNKAQLDMENYAYDVNVTVLMGKNSCTLDYYRSGRVTKKLCKNENMDYFDFGYFTDEFGNKYSYAKELEKSNLAKFKDCLRGLVSQTAIASPSFKKGSDGIAEFQKKMRKFHEALAK